MNLSRHTGAGRYPAPQTKPRAALDPGLGRGDGDGRGGVA